MKRKLALALALVAVLVATLLSVRQRDENRARAKRLTARLFSFDDRKVSGLDVQAGDATWRVVRASSGWRIVAPVDDVADASAVEALLGAVRRAPILKTIVETEALSSYGLAPPRAKLTLAGVPVPAVELGDVAPTGDGVFARLEGRPEVVLLGLPDATPFAKLDGANLRGRALVELARSEVVGLTLSPSGLRLAREADGWWITAPRRFPASTAAVDTLLGALYGAQVAGWDDEGSAASPRYGLAEAAAPTITLFTGSASQSITLGSDAGDGRRFVVSDGRRTILIADVPKAVASGVELAGLRETRLTNVNRYDVSRFVYASGNARFAATRKDDATWVVDAGGTLPAERIYVLLVALLQAETVGYVDGSIEAPESATLSYETGNGRATGRLTFAGERASWDALPGVVFRLALPPPPVPAGTSAQGAGAATKLQMSARSVDAPAASLTATLRR